MSFSNMTAVMENEVQQPIKKAIKNTCYHCGEDCDAEELRYSDKFFCCLGCKTVFEILDENGLCDYYDLEKSPGINLKNIVSDDKYAYLDKFQFDYFLKTKIDSESRFEMRRSILQFSKKNLSILINEKK